MQLTDIQLLSKDYTRNDSEEMASVMQSTFLSSPSGVLRWGKVKDAEAQAWMNNSNALSLKEEFKVQRMSTVFDLNGSNDTIPSNPCAEHLIIRDLDMEHIIENDGPTSPPGRVIAHADWRYTPRFDGDLADTPTGVNSGGEEEKNEGAFPAGFNHDLHKLLNDAILSSSATHFSGLPFFYLLGISTLTPSHLRRGIAKKLTQWIDPYVDHYSVPVVLYASPLGLHLYRTCGYEEYRDLDVAIDLARWGVQDVHRHVVMIRWPKDENRLSDAWKEWKRNHS